MIDPLTQRQHLEKVKAEASQLAVTLRDAADAGVSHMLILPQLVLVFKEAFGEMPPDMAAAISQAQQQIPEQAGS